MKKWLAIPILLVFMLGTAWARGVDSDELCKRLQNICENPNGIVATDSLAVLLIAVRGGSCEGGCHRCDLE